MEIICGFHYKYFRKFCNNIPIDFESKTKFTKYATGLLHAINSWYISRYINVCYILHTEHNFSGLANLNGHVEAKKPPYAQR